MLHIGLYEPEIPPNTGNIMRLCANTGCALHLIKPLGFSLEEKQLRRAGLDYRDLATVTVHDNLPALIEHLEQPRTWAFTTKADRRYTDAAYAAGDLLLFGPETRGLPKTVLEERGSHCLRVPMKTDSRSLNLSNTVALVAYEGLRQLGFGDLV